eukprot:CAMPEP_0198210262 /NCGR_PEP_ID=MMETSP1445-20131203/19989_1 /TAXON_ID=36898 /ORGANISM="Pyramimonas sp., Strain CCMP2087" /LENGTH=415 /DNA_ID=CAMNT_0043884281 /DNA_START=221 /DNA_END=1468 /DNA_ORIENTATION=-
MTFGLVSCSVSTTRVVSSSIPRRKSTRNIVGCSRVAAVPAGATRFQTAMVKSSGATGHGLLARAPLSRSFAPLDMRKKRLPRNAMSVQAWWGSATAAAPAAAAVAAAAAPQAAATAAAGTSALGMLLKTLLLAMVSRVNSMLTDPWKPMELYVVILFFYLLKPTLWTCFKGFQGLRRDGDVSQETFDKSFFGFLNGPLYVHGLGMAFNWLMDTVVFAFDSIGFRQHGVLTWISNSDTAVYIVVFGAFLYKMQQYYLDEFLDFFVGKNSVDVGLQDLLHRILEVVIVLGTFGWASHSLGVSTSLITGLYSLLGIGFGFASQEVLQNFFGGLMLVAMQPFTVGDEISFTHPGGEMAMSGRVLRVGYYQTHLITEEGSTLSIPNQWFVTVEITNMSRTTDYFEMKEYQKVAFDSQESI